MALLKDWRDAIVTKLKTDITVAAQIVPTTNPKLTLALQTWPSPTIMVELETLHADDPRLVGMDEQTVEIGVNVYIAVRIATVDAVSQELEYNEEAISVGVLDLIDAVTASLKGYDVQASPIARLFLKSYSEYGEDVGATIWRVQFTLRGNYIS